MEFRQYHLMNFDAFCDELNTDLNNGLTEQFASFRLQVDGKNVRSKKTSVSWVFKQLRSTITFLNIFLLISSLICLIAYAIDLENGNYLYLGIVLLAILIEVYENKENKAFYKQFEGQGENEVMVIRDGRQKVISACKLVKGDLIEIHSGDKLPADVRIVSSNDMKVDNSSLTGEREPLQRGVDCTSNQFFETQNIAFCSTHCLQGTARGIVIFTAHQTVIGQILQLANTNSQHHTPLSIKIKRFALKLILAAWLFGVVAFLISYLIGFTFIDAFILAVGVTVSNIIHGYLELYIGVTKSLALAARNYANNNILIKNMEGAEALAYTTCLVVDKTGVLTRNKMSVASLWYNCQRYEGKHMQTEERQSEYDYNIFSNEFKDLQNCAMITSTAIFDKSKPNGNKKVEYRNMATIGDTSQSALIRFYQPIDDIVNTRSRFPFMKNKENQEIKLQFNSANDFMLSLHAHQTQESDVCLFSKGAPQKILKMCTHTMIDGQLVWIDDEGDEYIRKAMMLALEKGERVIAFSKYHLPRDLYNKDFQFNCNQIEDINFPINEQVFLGFISINDPPRQQVPQVIANCKQLGIKVIMATADHIRTATTIARSTNIITQKDTVQDLMSSLDLSFDQAFQESNAIAINADFIEKMNIEDEEKPEQERGKMLQRCISKPEVIFGRVTPDQKLLIVSVCQKMGHSVTMIGDGINDSPAVKIADLGISMGSGTDVTKDSAGMILLDDNFDSIIFGIVESRKIYARLQKSLTSIVSNQIFAIFPFVLLLILQIPSPISIIFIFCLDLTTHFIQNITEISRASSASIKTKQNYLEKADQKYSFSAFKQNGRTQQFIRFLLCQLAFLIVFSDFGFKATDLFYKNKVQIYSHARNDFYDKLSPYFGNSQLIGIQTCEEFQAKTQTIDWLYSNHLSLDLRMSALQCHENAGKLTFTQIFDFGECTIRKISSNSKRSICYSTEAAKFARSGFIYSYFIGQILALILQKLNKSHKISISNKKGVMPIQFIISVIIGFIYPVSIGNCLTVHHGVVVIPALLLILAFEEFRKYLKINIEKDDLH